MGWLFKRNRISIPEDRSFDPALRRSIARFLDRHFEDEEVHEEKAVIGRAALEEAAESFEFDAAPMAPAPVGAPSEYDESPEPHLAAPPPSYSAPASASRAAPTYGAAPVYDVGMPEYAAAAPAPGESLKSWLDRIDEPFSTTLLALIDHKGLSDTEVYKRANMSRQLFSRIRSDANYRPAKKTVLALSVAMRLSVDEMRDLLERAGFALSHADKRDIIVEYFVSRGDWDLFAINEALYEFDQPLI